jgi:hypothetical protein
VGCTGYDWHFSASGIGNLSHLGKVEFDLAHCTTSVSPLLAEWNGGSITFTVANGDTLVVAESGDSDLQFVGEGPPIGFTYVGVWEVIDGTGRFLNALVLDVTGVISYDASDQAK